jgi:MFS transporter, VNT family, synaptic vesicle glycoprotein 2
MDQNSTKKIFEFEEAIKKCGFGKFNYIFMLIAGSLMACAFMELTSINFVFPVAECDLNLSTSDKGILSAIGYVGVILSSFLWGFLSDTKGRRKTLIVTLLVAFIATVLSSFVENFWLMVSLRFVNGFL